MLTVRVLLLATASLLVVATAAEAQLGDRLRQRAKQRVEERVERTADQAVNKTLDAVEGAIRCAATDSACIEKARQEGREVEITDAQGNPVAQPSGAPAAGTAAASQRVGEGAWANYDFVPGERVLFADDFSADRVGNFPRRLDFIDGTWEIVEMQGSRYLRATSGGRFRIILPEALPERFTIEFEAHLPNEWHTLYLATAEPEEGYRSLGTLHQLQRYPYSYFQLGHYFQSGIRGPGGGEALTRYEPLLREIVPVRIMADGSYAKVFLNERRVANVPNANLRRSNSIGIFVAGDIKEDRPVFIGNIRIAAGGRALYDALQAEGRVATQGILFDTGSDRIRPESTPTLKEIGEMLRQHSSLRLRIEGHTDNVGQAAANQALSERRAVAVMQHLVSSYGIDAGRLDAVGKGQTEPAAGNDTPEGRQTNRRVVLVRL